jgi:FtsH-binding integral membrane protein
MEVRHADRRERAMRMTEIMGRPMLPREHGAWAVLYGSFLAGVGVAGRVTLPVGYLLVAVTAAALANAPLGALIRPAPGAAEHADRRRAQCWLAVYGGLAVLALLPLFLVYHLTFLVAFGMAAACFLLCRAYLIREREDRSLTGELLGMAGLSLVGPVAHAVSLAAATPTGGLLWILLTLFFASGIFHVRMRIRSGRGGRQGGHAPTRAAFRSSLAYHLLLLAGLPLLAAAKLLPWAVFLAFAPALWRAAAGLRRPEGPLDVRRLGWSEVAQTAVFLLLLVATLRLSGPLG